MAAGMVMALIDGLGLQTLLGVGMTTDEKTIAAIKRGIQRAVEKR